MSRFSAITRGIRATKAVEFPMADGTVVRCAVRPLLVSETAGALAEARAFAKYRGVEEPKDDNPIYQLGVWIYTLLVGCVDVDSTDQAPFFDGGADQIQTLDVDRLAFLYEQQQGWQDYCAPTPKSMGGDAYLAKLLEVAASEEGDDGPFVKLPRSLLESFARITAKQLVSLVPAKLASGSLTETDSTKSTKLHS